MRRLLAAVVVAGVVLVGCGGSDDAATDTFHQVEITDFDYLPADLSVPAGEEVTVSLENTGSITHEWIILEQGVVITDEEEFPEDVWAWESNFWGQELTAGQGSSFNFTAPAEPGTYQIICAIPGHLSAGMVGELTVEG